MTLTLAETSSDPPLGVRGAAQWPPHRVSIAAPCTSEVARIHQSLFPKSRSLPTRPVHILSSSGVIRTKALSQGAVITRAERESEAAHAQLHAKATWHDGKVECQCPCPGQSGASRARAVLAAGCWLLAECLFAAQRRGCGGVWRRPGTAGVRAARMRQTAPSPGELSHEPPSPAPHDRARPAQQSSPAPRSSQSPRPRSRCRRCCCLPSSPTPPPADPSSPVVARDCGRCHAALRVIARPSRLHLGSTRTHPASSTTDVRGQACPRRQPVHSVTERAALLLATAPARALATNLECLLQAFVASSS